jgi:hypothetical protein
MIFEQLNLRECRYALPIASSARLNSTILKAAQGRNATVELIIREVSAIIVSSYTRESGLPASFFKGLTQSARLMCRRWFEYVYHTGSPVHRTRRRSARLSDSGIARKDTPSKKQVRLQLSLQARARGKRGKNLDTSRTPQRARLEPAVQIRIMAGRLS